MHRIAEDFLRKEVETAGFRLWQCWMGKLDKMEPPQGDETREWGPPFDDAGDASYFIGINRNKQSVGLDLSKPAGREVLMRLLEDADVLVENFKPGSMEKWALGYEDVLSKRFPA